MSESSTEKVDPEERELLEEGANVALSETFDAGPRVVTDAAWNVGNRLLAACHDELTAAGIRKSEETRFILSRLERRIKSEVLAGYREILQAAAPAARAELKKVTFEGEKIQGNLVIDKNTEERHELADFAGRDVLVILAEDINEHLADMEETVEQLAQLQVELDLDLPPITPGKAREILDAGETSEKSGLETAIDEHIAAADAELAADSPKALQKLADIPESRHILDDGEMIGIAPDPDCAACAGAGGWDIEVEDENDPDVVTDEWVVCDCIQYEI